MAGPLRGKVFYLDLPPGRGARDLAAAIGRLGGVTESFLSKEVTYVISSNKEAKRDKTDKQSTTTSEDAKGTSPAPSASKGNHARPHQKAPDTALSSRGKEMLQKAIKNQDTCSGSSILANARLWGVQILHVDEMLSYIEGLLRAASGARTRCHQTEAKCLAAGAKVHKGKLKPPFLKVEDESSSVTLTVSGGPINYSEDNMQFRPFHLQFKTFPDLNFLAPKSSSPFEPLKSLSNSCRTRASEGKKSPRSTPVTVPKKRRGFCECCQENFDELQKHLQSPQHKRFALDDSQYTPVDCVISQLSNNFVERSAKVPQSHLTAERLVPQTQVTGGTEMLTAELGNKRQQPEPGAAGPLIDTECDRGLRTKGCSPCLPGDRVSKAREGGRLLENSSAPVGTGVTRGVCGTTEESAERDADPGLAGGTHVVAAHVGGPIASSCGKEQTLGSISQPPRALPASRKRQLSSRQSTLVGKKPRLELGGGLSPCKQRSPAGGGMGAQGAGQMSEPGLPSAVEAGSLASSTELSKGPRSSHGLKLCPHRNPGDPPEAVPMGFGPTEAAAANAVSERGWSRANLSSQGKRLRGENENTPRNVNSPDLESTMSRTSCHSGWLPSLKPPVAEGRCCSLCVRAAQKIAPKLPDLPGHGQEWAPCPRVPQPLPHKAQAEPNCSKSSSESDWDVQLLSTLSGVQDNKIQSVDRDLLLRTHVSVRDSGYESQLCSVLKQKSELAWAGKEDKICRNCCTDTKGASFPIFETTFGSWTS